MKKKLLAFILGFTLILTACGASSSFDKAYPEQANEAQSSIAMSEEIGFDEVSKNDMVISEKNSSATSDTKVDMPRKLVKNSNLNLETKEFDKGLPYLLALIEENGGYIQNQSTRNKSLYNKNERFCREATIVARIPAENFEATEDKISENFNITYKNDYIDDITDNYYDTQAHLNTLQLQEKKLLQLLDKAEELSDIIELEKALAECRANIDSFTGKLKRMDNQVVFSTINITLNEVIEYQDSYNAPLTFSEKIKNSFAISGRHLKNFFSGLLFFAIEDLPVIILQIGIIAIVVRFIVVIIKKIKKSIVKKSSIKTTKPEIAENKDIENK